MATREKIVLPNSGITVRVAIYYWQDWHPMDQRDATFRMMAATERLNL